MVQAIIEGRKTMTRRIVKMYSNDDHPARQNATWLSENKTCPYGEVGDVLWVRESFTPDYFDNHQPAYKADWTKLSAEYAFEPKWKPSIHMPKAAARIFLEVVSIRVEQLLSISFEDAEKEGILGLNCCKRYFDYVSNNYTKPNSISSFRSLWVSINGRKSWNSNPWVYVIEFKRIDKHENF